jgi:hypothetical protein
VQRGLDTRIDHGAVASLSVEPDESVEKTEVLLEAVRRLRGQLFGRLVSEGVFAVHSARHCPASSLDAHRSRRLGALCGMGVAGSDQDSGSEHPRQSSRNLAGAGNFISMGTFPRVSIDMIRSVFSKIMKFNPSACFLQFQTLSH